MNSKHGTHLKHRKHDKTMKIREKERTKRKRKGRKERRVTKDTKRKHRRRGRRAGVLGRAESAALLQSISKSTKKDFPPEIVKDIASKIHPELREDVKNELTRRTRRVRERLERLEEEEDEPEDAYGRHYLSEYECRGCESGVDYSGAHCTACREGRL